MAQHFQLREPDSPNLVNQLSKQGNGSFFVKPISRNEGVSPIENRAVVDLLGKKVRVKLTHRVKDSEDPEPSVAKWSYFMDLCMDYRPLTILPEDMGKDYQSCYVLATAGNTSYSSSGLETTYISIGNAFTDYDMAKDSAQVGLYRSTYNSTSSSMILGEFTMFYKKPTTDPDTGDIIIPSDTSESVDSVKARKPCNVAISQVPSWITNIRILYVIKLVISSTFTQYREYSSWSDFRSAWDSILADPQYSSAGVSFLYRILGKVATYSETTKTRGRYSMVIEEIAGDDNKIWGAKPLYLYLDQLPGYKKISLYYKQASTDEVNYDTSKPGAAIVTNNHNLRLQGSPCSVYSDDGYDTITLNKLTCRGVANNLGQDHRTISYVDGQSRSEYFYVGNPFFLGFVEETNLYKDNVGINLWDNPSALNFWHRCYFTGTSNKCTYDPEGFDKGQVAHLYQGVSTNLSDAGYTVLVPWAIRAGDQWVSPEEIPTASTNAGLTSNSHRILAIDWITKALSENPSLNKDSHKDTSDILYGGAFSINVVVQNRDKKDGGGWVSNPNAGNSNNEPNRLHNYLEYLTHLWDNKPTNFGSVENLRNVKEVLFIPIIVTAGKLCPSNPLNGGITSMCWGKSLIPNEYSNHDGYAEFIGIFPPTVTNYYNT